LYENCTCPNCPQVSKQSANALSHCRSADSSLETNISTDSFNSAMWRRNHGLFLMMRAGVSQSDWCGLAERTVCIQTSPKCLSIQFLLTVLICIFHNASTQFSAPNAARTPIKVFQQSHKMLENVLDGVWSFFGT
jgi:hypothetical protein